MVVTLDDVDDGNKLYSAGMSKAVLFGGGFIYVRVISARCNETGRTEREMNKNIYYFLLLYRSLCSNFHSIFQNI